MPFKDPIVKKNYHKKYYKKNKKQFSINGRNRRKRIRASLNRIKSECGCKHCGYDNPICLDFHHINPKNKSFSISVKVHYKLIDLLRESEKCEVLCANCHRIEEYKRNKNSYF